VSSEECYVLMSFQTTYFLYRDCIFPKYQPADPLSSWENWLISARWSLAKIQSHV